MMEVFLKNIGSKELEKYAPGFNGELFWN